LGFLLNRSRPEFEAILDDEGFIAAVDLIEPLRTNRPAVVSDTISHGPSTMNGAGDESTPDPESAGEIEHIPEFPVDIDPEQPVDKRRREESLRVIREGRQEFKDSLIILWEGKCIITETNVRRVLDGAHIFPYLGKYTNHATNGLLLRADIHRLFDDHLLSISVADHQIVVHVSHKLKNSSYWNFNDRRIAIPGGHALAERYVEHHYREFERKRQTAEHPEPRAISASAGA